MRKKTTLFLIVLFVSALTIGLIPANAAVKESVLTEGMLTDTGLFNFVDWEQTGENTDAYRINNKGSFLRFEGAGFQNYWIFSGNTLPNTADVTMEFDILTLSKDSYLFPCSWGTVFAGSAESAEFFYSDRPIGKLPQIQAGFRYRMIFGLDGSLEITRAAVNANGSYGAFEACGEKIANYCTVPAAEAYYFGFKGHNGEGKPIDIDNFKLLSGTNVVISGDFTETKIESNGVPTKDTLTVLAAKILTVSEMNVVNPAADNRLVCTEEIKIDSNISQAFEISAQLRLNQLSDGGKVGLAFGLTDASQSVGAGQSTFLFFENQDDLTHLKVMNGGSEGKAVSLESNLVGDAFIELLIAVDREGTASVTVNGVAYEFELEHIAGLVAIGHIAAEEVDYTVNSKLLIRNFAYREGSGSSRGINFNTGYVNLDHYSYLSTNAAMIADPTETAGIVFENGEMFFKGVADGSYFGFVETYADFILEFDYTTLALQDRPALKEEWKYGYSGLGIHFGANNYGWSGGSNHGKAIYLIDHFKEQSILQFAYYNETGVTSTTVLETYGADGAGVAQDGMVGIYQKTTKFKIVAANNVVKIYAVNLTEGKALKDYQTSDYRLLASFECKDTYGLVNFASTESGYFKLDNVKITKLDALTYEEVAQNVADYRDFEPIADEYEPVTLAKPSIRLDGAVASWNAVEHATGYELTVDGVKTIVGKDTLSYTFTQTASGSYRLKVRAVYDGELSHIADGEEAEIVYTVETSGCSGCGGDSSIAAMLLLVCGLTVLKIKR